MKSKAFNLNQFKFIMKQTITNFQSSYWQSQYNKALSRLERAVSSGRFAQFTQPPKTQLPNRLSRYARHLGLAMKPTLIAAGIAAGLTLATPSTAQTFAEQTGAANPLNGVDVGFRAAPTFVDIDNDGDKDAFIGEATGTILYYKNTGTAAAPVFTVQTGAANPFNGVDIGNNANPTFVDIDNDGDKDAFIGENDGTINYYKNTGTAAAPVFAAQTGAANPFNGVDVGTFSGPIFEDIDNDGDKDAFIGESGGTIKYYKNTTCTTPTTLTPTVSIAASPTGSITAGTSVTFTASPTNGGTTPAYQWKKGSNNVGSNSATYTDVALANNDKITCVLTSSDACASPTTATSNEITMTVNAACTNSTAYNVTGGSSYCTGGTGVAIGLSNSETGVMYQLKKGGVDEESAKAGTGSALTWANKTAGTYTVVATRTSGGCTATMTGSATVTLGTAVTPSVSIAANLGNRITSGTSVTFTATPSNGGTTPVYQWKLNGNNVGTNQDTYASTTLANGDVITCEMTSNATCALPTMATSNGITMTVTTPCASPTTLTQSTSQNVVAFNSISCNDVQTLHENNSYWRAFNLTNAFDVSAVEIGVETAKAGGTATTQPMTVRIYNNTGGAFPAGTRNLVGTANYNVADQTLTRVSIPVTASLPMNAQMVVEIFTPKGGGNKFYIGSNAAGESAPSYISAAACGLSTPKTFASVSTAKTVHLVMNVVGCENTVCSTPAPTLANSAHCQGDNAPALTATGTNLKWYAAATGGTGSTTAPIPSTATVGTVSHWVTQTIGSCESERAKIDVTTKAPPTVSITGANTICIGSTTNLSPASGGTWVSSSDAIATVNSSGIATGVSNGTATFRFTETSTGCQSAPTSAVTVNTTSTPSVSIAANPSGPITTGTSVTFTATPTNGGTTPVYQWKKNGNNVGTNQDTYASTTLANGDVITCEMTSNAACASPTLATSNGITMIVNSPCTAPTAYMVTGGGPICTGGVGLPINLANTLSTTIYQLYLNGSATGSPLLGIDAAGTFGPQTAAGTYTVVATLLTGGCTATMTGSPTIYYPPTVTKFYVNAAATGTNDGSTWANAFTNLQSATDYACLAANAEIWVAAGTYKPSAYPIGSTGNATTRDYSFCLQGSTKLYGGFAGTETSIAQRNIAANPTTLSGDIGTVGVATDNVYHIILLPPDVSAMPVLDGFTISGGNANGAGSTVLGAIGILRNSGGGIFGQSNGISVANCTFSGNAASQTGGAVSIEGTPVSSYVNCKFLNNSSASVAGGVFTSNPLMVTNCVFAQNTASLGGAGLGYSGPGTANISNTVFSGNNAFIGGAFSLAGGGTVNFGQCTFSGNTGFVSATGTAGNPFFLKNCIVWGTANSIGVNTGDSLSVGNSTVMGGLPVGATNLGGNLTTNPLFVNAADADGADNIFGTSDDGLHLQVCSPAANSGSNTFIPNGLTTDFASNPRIYNSGTVDMGAYELQTTSPIPAVFAMTGGGSYCTGGAGVAVGLSNSETGVTYQLKNGAADVGSPVSGTTGSAISFSNQTTAATYTVLATRTTGGCTATMTGSAIVTITSNVTPSVSIAQSPSGTVQPNTSVMFTATPTNGGTPTYQWQKGGSAISGETNATYTLTSTTAMNGDVITCVMTSNATCASPTTATSTGITISVCNCDPTCSPIPGGSAIPYVATTSRTDALGYTHYCDGTGNLLLSLKIPAGTTIPASAVKVQVGATAATFYSHYCGGSDAASSCFMAAADGNALINRNWFINQTDVTGTAIGLTNQLSIVSYFKDSDYNALNTILTANGGTELSATTALKIYLPKANTSFGEFPAPNMLKPLNSIAIPWSNGAAPTISTWKLTSPQTGINTAEFKVSNLKNTGGIGKFQ